MTETTDAPPFSPLACEAGDDPIEDRLRATVRATIEAVFEEELAAFLGRLRYDRGEGARKGYRHGHRERRITGTFGTEAVRVPRARIEDEDGEVSEWRSRALPRYRRLTRKAEALIAAIYLAGTNTRRVKRALAGLFVCAAPRPRRDGAVGKDVVSRASRRRRGAAQRRKVKVDWEAWCARSLADEDVVRLILDGTVIRTRLDRKATNISVLAAIGVRRDGQKVLLSIRNMGGESPSSTSQRPTGALRPASPERSRPWRQFLEDLDARGLGRPEFVIVVCNAPRLRRDGGPGLEAALTALWGEDLAVQRCTVHKHRNLLAHAPEPLHDELTEDYRDTIYADTAAEVATRRKAFLRKWSLECRAVADSLEEAGERLFTFTRLDPSQWKSARTTNAIERLNEEFRRRIKTQTVLPCADPKGRAKQRDRAHAALGAARLRSDHHAQGRWPGNPRPAPRAHNP
jgi:transposase-like protein